MCELIAQLSAPDLYLQCFLEGASIDQNEAEADTQAQRLLPDLRDHNHIIRPNHLVTALVKKGEQLQSAQVRWGWSPFWSMGIRPPLTHLPLEIVMRSKVFARMRDGGRALVAADGWFDFAQDADVSQLASPRFTYVRPRTAGPVYLAALAQISDSANGCNGLVLVTRGGGGTAGPLQLLVLDSERASRWLDPGSDWQQALALASDSLGDPQAFEQISVRQRALPQHR